LGIPIGVIELLGFIRGLRVIRRIIRVIVIRVIRVIRIEYRACDHDHA
jgi:hypothetical protein